jgi:hypothetical protein
VLARTIAQSITEKTGHTIKTEYNKWSDWPSA